MISNYIGILFIIMLNNWFGIKFKSFFDLYKECMDNVAILESPENLTVYKNKSNYYMASIRKFKVFKKSNFDINSYYWSIKTKDSSYYYTTTDNEVETLSNILKTTKISEFRSKCVNDFFKYCLVSYITKENKQQMKQLSRGEMVTLHDGVCIRTEEYFEENSGKEFTKKVTPDLFISCKEQYCIIVAYNGTNLKEIKTKISYYSRFSKTKANFYVFSSGVSTLEQLTAKKSPVFTFYCMENGDLNAVAKIQCGSIVLDIGELREKYFTEYSIFKNELHYWLHCEKEGTIVKTNDKNEVVVNP